MSTHLVMANTVSLDMEMLTPGMASVDLHVLAKYSSSEI